MKHNKTIIPMIIIGILFFIFGFVTWLNGSLIPFLKAICHLNEFEALFVTFAFYISYTLMALPMSYLLRRSGYKNGMAIGLGIMAFGALVFIPAALSANFVIFLSALFLLGMGLTLLQSASNPYVVLIGPIESAAMRISIMGLINKFAGVVVPLVFTSLILSGIGSLEDLSSDDLDALALKLIVPYAVMGAVLTALVALVKFSSLPELEFEDDADIDDDKSIFSFAHTVLGAVALFFYVGIEVIAGDTIGLYAQNIGIESATSLTSYTMIFMVIGYMAGIVFIPKYLSSKSALMLSAISGIIFVLGIVFSSKESHFVSEMLWGWSKIATLPDTITFVAMLGLSNALVWPTIWPLALKGLNKHTSQGSALLIMAIAGGAILPLVFGKISQLTLNMQYTYLIGIVCYLFILFYALKWHKITSWS